MDSSSNAGKFRFWQALAVSLALHALLLAQTLPLPHFSAAAAPLLATLRQVAQYAREYPQEKPVEPAVQAQSRSKASSAQPDAAAVVSVAPAVEPVPPAQPPTVPALASGAPSLAPVARATAARAPASRAPQSRAPGSAEYAGAASPGIDSDSLRQYRFSLVSAARRFKRYPPLARERGESGRAEVRLGIAADGSSMAPQISTSSGFPLLDQAAVDMVARAAQATSVPARLQGSAFAVILPVEFDLEEQ